MYLAFKGVQIGLGLGFLTIPCIDEHYTVKCTGTKHEHILNSEVVTKWISLRPIHFSGTKIRLKDRIKRLCNWCFSCIHWKGVYCEVAAPVKVLVRVFSAKTNVVMIGGGALAPLNLCRRWRCCWTFLARDALLVFQERSCWTCWISLFSDQLYSQLWRRCLWSSAAFGRPLTAITSG